MTLKILFVTNYAQARRKNPSAGIFSERQERSLREVGVDVRSFDIGNSYSPVALFRSWRALRAEIRRVRPHLLHAQFGSVTAAVAVLTFHPAVITFGGGDLVAGDFHAGSRNSQRNLSLPLSLARARIAVLLSNLAALLAAKLICVSEELRQKLWWRNEAAVVIPRGVDTDLFTPGSRAAARAELGWDHDARIVLSSGGSDWKTKGLDFVESAMAIARRTIPDLQLHVIHDVPPDRMPLLYRAADVLVCASRQEGSPNMIKEALACELPIVSVRVGDVEERLRGVTPSVLVDRTPEAIAAGITELVHQPRRSNGREAALGISLPAIAERIIDVYRQALQGRRDVLSGQ